MSPESEIINVEQDSILDIEDIGSPTEPGHMDIDNDLADQSQKMVIDTEMTLEPAQAETSTAAAEENTELETPILDMTKDEEHATTEEGNPYVFMALCHIVITQRVLAGTNVGLLS